MIEIAFRVFFRLEGVEAHDLETTDDIYMDFFDNLGVPLNSVDLYGIIRQKNNCACFYIEIKVSGKTNKSINAEVNCDYSCRKHVHIYTNDLNIYSNCAHFY